MPMQFTRHVQPAAISLRSGVETSATLVLATDGSGAPAVATMSAIGLAFNVADESVVDPHWKRHFEVVLLALPGE